MFIQQALFQKYLRGDYPVLNLYSKSLKKFLPNQYPNMTTRVNIPESKSHIALIIHVLYSTVP